KKLFGLSRADRASRRAAEKARQTARRKAIRPQLESLEDRLAPAINVGLNFDGPTFTGVSPGSVNGDVGLNHYVVAVHNFGDAQITVYDKPTGTPIAGFQNLNMSSLVAGAPAGQGDPTVTFDHLSNRWILTESEGPGPTKGVEIYVSQTPDPTGS